METKISAKLHEMSDKQLDAQKRNKMLNSKLKVNSKQQKDLGVQHKPGITTELNSFVPQAPIQHSSMQSGFMSCITVAEEVEKDSNSYHEAAFLLAQNKIMGFQ